MKIISPMSGQMLAANQRRWATRPLYWSAPRAPGIRATFQRLSADAASGTSPHHIADVYRNYLIIDVQKLWTIEPVPYHSSGDSGTFSARLIKSMREVAREILTQSDSVSIDVFSAPD